MNSLKKAIKNSPQMIHKTIKKSTQEFITYQTSRATKDFLSSIQKNLSNHFFIESKFSQHPDVAKPAIEVLTRISKHTKKYVNENGDFKRNQIFFLPVKNHHTAIRVETPNVTDKYSDIKILFMGLDALTVAQKFFNTLEIIRDSNTEIGINTLIYNPRETKSSPWNISYKTTVAKNINEIFTDTDIDSLITHIKEWDKAKDFYSKLNLIHKTGILLYGPPGTGKTTLAKAIAKAIKASVYIINMGEFSEMQIEAIKNDMNDYGEGECPFVLIFEDIDCIFSTRDKLKEEKQQKAAQLLLQFLDGVFSMSDVIFIATTNHIESLDSALIRDGRFDIKVEMKNISKPVAEKMCQYFEVSSEEVPILLKDETFPINPAYLQNKIVKHTIAKMNGANHVSA